MIDPALSCRQETRRDAVRAASLFGLDYAEVSDDQRTIYVYFLGKAPQQIEMANLRLQGGQRIRDVQVVNLLVHRQVDPTLDDYMEVAVNKPGDFSTYTLSIVKLDDRGDPTGQPADGFDPRYDAVSFSFKAACPTGLDCKSDHVCPPPERAWPEINYLAKDYASFRQLILDRLALVMPRWHETHVPDLGIALVELLAYVGDYLSYYQDAVATEPYLNTARQRISVRRHVRLVDYAMHEGCNARAWVTLNTDTDEPFDATEIEFITPFPGVPDRNILTPDDLSSVPEGSFDVFQPLLPKTGTIWIYQAHSTIHFYSWGDRQCCLAKGATAATLLDQWVSPPEPPVTHPSAKAPSPKSSEPASDGPPGTVRALKLKAGDVLILEEVIGPGTGNAADADLTHRQAVRLTSVTPTVDPLVHPYGGNFGQPIVEIEWAQEDALTFPLCISVQGPPPACQYLDNVSVARGNVILVDHGESHNEALGTVPIESTTSRCPTECSPAETTITPGLFRPRLSQRPLAFGQPLPVCGSASALSAQDPRQALPQIALADGSSQAWSPVADLLESGPDDRSFVVEMDDDGDGHIRFGDGILGRMPDAGSAFQATYRTGNGPSGNVGAGKIAYIVLLNQKLSGVNLVPCNPLPASGGTDPEPVADVKLFAPTAFRDVLERAITADDYASLAADNSRRKEERSQLIAAATNGGLAVGTSDRCSQPFQGLQAAKATLRWNGSWYTALVAIDPLGTEGAKTELVQEITTFLEPYRRIGHDLLVSPAEYVPLDLAITVCVLSDYLRAQVERALLDIFSNRVLADQSKGFFHPDNLTFGQGVFVSKIIAAAQAVTGVQNVRMTRLERFALSNPAPGENAAVALPPGGVLTLGPLEIARLDNDPDFPENGRLSLDLRGGR
jgi:hypothetical protein